MKTLFNLSNIIKSFLSLCFRGYFLKQAVIKGICLSVMFCVLSCTAPPAEDGESYSGDRTTDLDDDEDDDEDISSRRDEDTDYRSSEIRRLKTRRVIKATLERRFDGGGSYSSQYDGRSCSRSDDCIALCKKWAPKKRKQCERSPQAFVESLEDGFYILLNISDLDSVNISPDLMQGMLDVSESLIKDYVEEAMSEGDLKSFLAWVALNEDISDIFLKEDRRHLIIKAAFDRLGDYQLDEEGRVSSKDRQKVGLNVGLIQFEDTFFHLSALESNPSGFKIAYDILQSLCPTKDCKLEMFCAREKQTRERSRFEIFNVKCRTSSSQSRRARRQATCYIHGASTWSFLDEMIEDRDRNTNIRDKDFTGEQNQITVTTCNSFCGPENDSNKKCNTLL